MVSALHHAENFENDPPSGACGLESSVKCFAWQELGSHSMSGAQSILQLFQWKIYGVTTYFSNLPMNQSAFFFVLFSLASAMFNECQWKRGPWQPNDWVRAYSIEYRRTLYEVCMELVLKAADFYDTFLVPLDSSEIKYGNLHQSIDTYSAEYSGTQFSKPFLPET